MCRIAAPFHMFISCIVHSSFDFSGEELIDNSSTHIRGVFILLLEIETHLHFGLFCQIRKLQNNEQIENTGNDGLQMVDALLSS